MQVRRIFPAVACLLPMLSAVACGAGKKVVTELSEDAALICSHAVTDTIPAGTSVQDAFTRTVHTCFKDRNLQGTLWPDVGGRPVFTGILEGTTPKEGIRPVIVTFEDDHGTIRAFLAEAGPTVPTCGNDSFGKEAIIGIDAQPTEVLTNTRPPGPDLNAGELHTYTRRVPDSTVKCPPK